MNFKFVKRGILIATIMSSILIPSEQVAAAEGTILLGGTQQEKVIQIEPNCLVKSVAEIQKQENIEKTIKIKSLEEIQFEESLKEKVFVHCEEDYIIVLATADENSDWVGKVFDTSVVEVVEKGETWSKVQSGDVVGYVKTEALIIGNDAVSKAKEILTATYPEADILALTMEEIEASFATSETKEAEQARLAAEEAARIAAEQAAKEAAEAARRQKGVDLVNYAKRFLGNRYVYGGTSLTRGTDCSGFVMSVYAHYGVSLPHSSYSMRSVGRRVSIKDIQPGDIVCYSGHVGIYAGNGQIVNAINERMGIGMSSLNARTVITVRRIF